MFIPSYIKFRQYYLYLALPHMIPKDIITLWICFAKEVRTSPPQEIRPPVIAVARYPNRPHSRPTTGPERGKEAAFQVTLQQGLMSYSL
jgi:hypothetical protein